MMGVASQLMETLTGTASSEPRLTVAAFTTETASAIEGDDQQANTRNHNEDYTDGLEGLLCESNAMQVAVWFNQSPLDRSVADWVDELHFCWKRFLVFYKVRKNRREKKCPF